MNTYTSIKDITIFSFYKILETSDYTYLYKRKKDRNDKSKLKELFEIWNLIYDEYVSQTEDANVLNNLRLIDEIDYLETRFMIVKELMGSISEYNKKVFGEQLKTFDIIFNPNLTVDEQRENLLQQLRAATNKIKRKRSELALMQEEVKKPNMIREKLSVQAVIGIDIDIYKTTMEEYIEMKKMAEETVKAKSKNVRHA